MPRKTKHPIVYIALSPAALATAMQIEPRHIYAAIAAGHLEVRQLPGSAARRIWIGGEGGAENWFREIWQPAKPRRTKKEIT